LLIYKEEGIPANALPSATAANYQHPEHKRPSDDVGLQQPAHLHAICLIGFSISFFASGPSKARWNGADAFRSAPRDTKIEEPKWLLTAATRLRRVVLTVALRTAPRIIGLKRRCATMQIRTHPKMKWEGWSNWPPVWAGSYGCGDIFPVGEEGVLTGVQMNEASSFCKEKADFSILASTTAFMEPIPPFSPLTLVPHGTMFANASMVPTGTVPSGVHAREFVVALLIATGLSVTTHCARSVPWASSAP
jgi:hypothetical protein